nr:MAG TPA: DNA TOPOISOMERASE I [Caudoviricetes sp.]
MKAMNFYTANGWAGSNYDSKLSTKEIASKVRSYAKKNFPGFKFSVRSEWSMYTDSMYIELKAGTCVPFVSGSRSADRGYMSTMSTVKGWEDELTPELFSVLDAVTVYANSFKYDDSDGMQDYYDTNFYIHIKVSDEYKVVEPKAKKSGVKAEKVEGSKEVEAVIIEGIEVVDYSEKAIAVFGDTKAVKEQLKELGGRFNPALKYNGEKRSGWIFSKKQADKVKELITPTELPELTEETDQLEKSLDKLSIWDSLKTLDCILYDDYKAGLLTLEECARKFAKSGWTSFVDIEYTKAIFERIEQQENNAPLIIEDFAKYGCMDYPTECGELDEFKLGEAVYDQIGEIGVILAFYEKDGIARLNSNGCCNVGCLKKCPKAIAEKEVKYMDIIRPKKASDSYTVEAYEKKVTGKRYTVKDKPLTLGYYSVLDKLDNSVIDCYPTKEEALKKAERLNGFTDDNGRLRRII